MNYEKIYTSLCERGKLERQLDYCEVHHIIPRCMGGTNELNNLTKLSYREHYLAHYLLVKMFPDNSGINYAFLCMLRKHNENRILTSRMYDSIKTNFSKYKKTFCKLPNPGKSDNARKAARRRMLTDNPNKGGASNHTAKKIVVTYIDGSKEHFDYGSQLCEKLPISYGAIKYMIKHQTSSKKYGIANITQMEG